MAFTNVSPVHIAPTDDEDPPHWDEWFEALLTELRANREILEDILHAVRPRRRPPRRDND